MSFESEVKEVIFTSPVSDGPHHMTLLAELIDNTPKGGKIHVCISHFSFEPLADRFIAASRRGVSVGIIMEAHADIGNDAIREYIQNNSPIEITMAHGCFGSKIHTKLFLFSKTELNKNSLDYVAVFGSATMTESSLNKHQDMCVVADKEFYDGLHNHWQQMLQRAHPAPIGDGDAVNTPAVDIFSTSTRVKAYLFPRSSDAVLNVINNLRGDVHKDTGERPHIRIAMARWTMGRRSIVDALKDRLKDGCIIDLVLRIDPNWDEDSGGSGVTQSIVADFQVYSISWPGSVIVHIGSLDVVRENVHNKYFLIEGYYGAGSEWETNVWTGSPNWTRPALKFNDELMVKFRDAELYKRYVKNHDILKLLCRRIC